MARSDAGFVVIHRKLFNSEVAADPVEAWVFVLLIMWASWEDTPYMGEIIKRGQLVTGIDELSRATNLHRSTVSRKLKTLEKKGMLLRLKKHKGSLITIVNYDKYQDQGELQETQPATDVQPACNSPATDVRPLNNTNKTNNTNKGDALARVAPSGSKPSIADMVTLGVTQTIAALHTYGADSESAENHLDPLIWKVLAMKYPTNTWGNFFTLYKQAGSRGAIGFFERDLKELFRAHLLLLGGVA